MKHVKTNPQFVFEEKVDFRSSTGKFSKPFRAAYALVYFPRKRKPYILDLAWLGRRSNEATLSYVQDFLIEYYKELTRAKIQDEETRRAKIPSQRADRVPKKFTYKVERTESLPVSKQFGTVRKVIGFNYTFNKAFILNWKTCRPVLDMLGKVLISEIKKHSKKYPLKEYDVYVKYFGASYYVRQTDKGPRFDLSSFSVPRIGLADTSVIKPFIEDLTETYLKSLLGMSGQGGYLSRIVKKVVDEKGKDILDKRGKPKFQEALMDGLKMTGFRIEFSKIIKGG